MVCLTWTKGPFTKLTFLCCQKVCADWKTSSSHFIREFPHVIMKHFNSKYPVQSWVVHQEQLPYGLLMADFVYLLDFRHVHKIVKTSNFVIPVRLSVHMKQLGSHWQIFMKNLCLSDFQKYVQKILVSLKLDSINGCFTWGPISIFDHISFSSYNEKCFRQKLVRKSKHTLHDH